MFYQKILSGTIFVAFLRSPTARNWRHDLVAFDVKVDDLCEVFDFALPRCTLACMILSGMRNFLWNIFSAVAPPGPCLITYHQKMKFAVSRLIIFFPLIIVIWRPPPENSSSFICLCIHAVLLLKQARRRKNKNRSWIFFLSCCCRCPTIKSLPIVENTFVFVCLSIGLDT